MVMILMLSIIILSSSSDWVMMWLSLEINSLAFLMLSKGVSMYKTEFEFKYFYIQFIGSSLFLCSWLFNSFNMFFFSMMIKLIMMPFLNWILEDLKWVSLKFQLFFLSIQKIGPLLILWSLLIKLNLLMIFFIMFNMMFSMINGISKMNWIDLLAYSSIGQTSLMIILIYLSKASFFIFIICYIMSLMYLMMIYKYNLEKINLFIIISGFPPSLIFFAKIMFIELLEHSNLSLLILLTLFFSGMSYIYMKIFLNFYMKNFMSLNMNFSGGSMILLLLFIIFG